MYQPYVRQKLFEARAHELERIAEEDRAAVARRRRRRRSARPGVVGGISLSALIPFRRL
jgi:hypothetical protein